MATNRNFEWEGTERMIANLRAVGARIEDLAAKALALEAAKVFAKSDKRVPRAPDGGALADSGRVTDVTREGSWLSVEIIYGSPATHPYALAVHEHPSAFSPPTWSSKTAEQIHWTVPGTGVKFLEGPLNEQSSGMGGRIASYIRSNLGSALRGAGGGGGSRR